MMVSHHNYTPWWSIYWLRCVVGQAKMLCNCFYVIPCRLHMKWFKHYAFVFFLFSSYSNVFLSFLSLSDLMSVRVSGCAAMCIFRKCATTRCLGWRKELCTSSGFVLLIRPEQDARPRPPSPSSLQTPWNTPGPWVTHTVTLSDSQIAILCKKSPQLEKHKL